MNNFAIGVIILLLYSGCGRKSNNINVSDDSVKGQNPERVKLAQNSINDSANDDHWKNEFKIWLSDTLSFINEQLPTNYEVGLKAIRTIIHDDSLGLAFELRINDTIYSLSKYPDSTYLGSFLYLLKSEKIKFPKTPFEIRVLFNDYYYYIAGYKYDRSYSFDYFSIRSLASKIETIYTIHNGSVKSTSRQDYSSNW